MPVIPTRRFGRTELAMPVFSCGGMRYQQSWDDVEWDKIEAAGQQNLEATIRRALDLGITHIETARGYGSSERQLGRILPNIERSRFLLQTKIAPQETGAAFRELFEVSMERLGVEFVDLLSLHGINNRELFELSLQPGGSLAVAREIQREGRARFIGFSSHAPCSVIVDALKTGEFDYVNLHWYWIFQENWPAVIEAKRQDAGVFIISPNDKGGKLYAPPPQLEALCAPLSPMAFNDLFCLSHPEIHTLSLGASCPEDFDLHVDAIRRSGEWNPLVETIAARLTSRMEEVLGADWMASCYDGLPEWTEIPGEINLRMIVRLWNLDEAFGMREYAKMRYNLLGQGGHWFPGRNATEWDEASLLRALPQYPWAERLPALLREAHARWIEEPKKRLSSA